MKVRAVTAGCPLTWPAGPQALRQAAQVTRDVRAALEAAGLEVQTTRAATPPLDIILSPAPDDALARAAVDLAAQLEVSARDEDIGYVALGALDTLGTPAPRWRALLGAIPEIIRSTERVFCAASVAGRADGINLAATRACGDLIAAVGAQSADGFGNLRFAALANCPPHIPFFPAAYHDAGPQATVGLALEAADLAVDAFAGAATLEDARTALIDSVSAQVQRAATAARQALGVRSDVRFTGVDLSLAPFPADDRSIAHAFERLGLPAFGASGTLFLVSFLTECLQRAAERTGMLLEGHRFGFSGLMLPVLEDSVLAQRAAQGLFGVDSLLLYAAVCGLGLDTVPLPGDTPAGELGAIILDMAALAVRLDKPLTARLFPVPGKAAGDPVQWDFAFFSPSRVLPVRSLSPAGLLGAAQRYNPAPGVDRP